MSSQAKRMQRNAAKEAAKVRNRAEARADRREFEALAKSVKTMSVEEKEATWLTMLATVPEDKQESFVEMVRKHAVKEGMDFDQARYECAFVMALTLGETGQLEEVIDQLQKAAGPEPKPSPSLFGYSPTRLIVDLSRSGKPLGRL